jgi:glycosyltransferase involved in cell wall biosynthesis
MKRWSPPRESAVDLLAPPAGTQDAGRASLPSVSCVIPCRNEARNLDALLPLLCDVIPQVAGAWEVVLVDDGSTDDSAAVMRDWAELPGFRVVQLSRNFGKEAALTAGLQAARGDVVITMDADLQHPPALIVDMMSEWRKGADVVYAVRTNRDDESLAKRVGTRLFYSLLNRFDRFEVPSGGGDFRLMDRVALDALLSLPERNRFMKGLCAWIGFQSVALPYVPDVRAHGRSHYGWGRLIALSLDGLTAFTTWPLRIVSVVGAAMALAGFGYGAYLTLAYLMHGHPVSGWTTIVVTLMCFLGMQMLFLGIVGEYVGRIFEEVKHRPLYLVKRDFGHGLGVRRP